MADGRERASATPATAAGDCHEAVDRIETAARRVRDEQLARALVRLDEHGELTPHERAVVARLADSLARRLIARPTGVLAAAGESGDEEAIRVAMDLFGDGGGRRD